MRLLPRWLFVIPVQVGPVTEYARKLRPWMHTILVIQVIVCISKLLVLKEITGPLWMILISGVGWYALYMDLNITYVCVWGALCLIQGFLEFLTLLIPGVTGILTFSFLNTVVRVTTPLVYLLGALFAWHLFHDYESSQGHKIASFDPMARAVDTFHCDEKTPLAAASVFFNGMVNRAANAAKHMQKEGIQDGAAGTPDNPAAAAAHGAKDADPAYGAQQAFYGATQANSGLAPPGFGPQSAVSAPGPWQQAGSLPGMVQRPFSTQGGFSGGPNQAYMVPQHSQAPPGYGYPPSSAQSLLEGVSGAQAYGRP